MRTLARVLGVFFLIAALAVLAADLVAAGEGGDGEVMPLGRLWYALHPASLNLTQAVIERYIWEPLWDPVLAGFLRWPAVAVLGGLGVLLIAASFLRRPLKKTAAQARPSG